MPKIKIPEAFKYYDPFDLKHSEGILNHLQGGDKNAETSR